MQLLRGGIKIAPLMFRISDWDIENNTKYTIAKSSGLAYTCDD